jgi:hypothetical protein
MTRSMRSSAVVAGGFSAVVGLIYGAAALAAEPTADEVLKGRGLSLSGKFYVLQGESESGLYAKRDEVRTLNARFAATFSRLDQFRQADLLIKQIDEEFSVIRHERDQLQEQIHFIERNKMNVLRNRSFNTAQLEELRALEFQRDARNSRLNDLRLQREQSVGSIPPPQERRKLEGANLKQNDVFGRALVEQRRFVDPVVLKYDALAKDAEVKKALDTVRRAAKSNTLKLGPSDEFRGLVRELEDNEKKIRTVAVKTKREGVLFVVPVAFNSLKPTDTALDDRASMTTIPAGLAERIGLKPSPADPVVRRRTPGGKTVEARQMKAASIRVGVLTFTNVVCEVVPDEASGALPRLGKNFLQHVSYQSLPENGELVLARKALSPTTKRAGEGRSSPRKVGSAHR